MRKFFRRIGRVFRVFTPLYWRNRRKKNDLKNLAQSIDVVDKLIGANQIFWFREKNQFIIDERLALFFLLDKVKWTGFLNMLLLYAQYQYTYDATLKKKQKIEKKAVSEAYKQNPDLTESDIQRIRNNALDNISEMEIEVLKEIDFAIVRKDAPIVSRATEENGQLLVVGHYDSEKNLEMANWEEVKRNFMKG